VRSLLVVSKNGSCWSLVESPSCNTSNFVSQRSTGLVPIECVVAIPHLFPLAVVSTLLYDDLVIQESQDTLPDTEAASDLLCSKALEVGIERFVDGDLLKQFRARVEFAGLTQPDIAQALRELCSGLRSFADLKAAAKDFLLLVEQKTDSKLLRELAPVSVRLQNGRHTKIHYGGDKPPWIASRLQDFFGMRDTPRVGADRTPLVVHLLAPNQRAVQTTTDLAGFWSRLYPQVRRELMRRYPRHQWPESP
jgi:ATP-dependent helicase HrpB